MPNRTACLITALISLILSLSIPGSHAQQASVHGYVKDGLTGEMLPGVNIVLDSLGGTTTDDKGHFELITTKGGHTLSFQFIGYTTQVLIINLMAGESLEKNIQLSPRSIELNTAVVSASRYEQRLSDVTVSMEVIKKDYIENVNVQQLDEALRLVPGVDVIDGQTNIRGGSGYSYGAGSRVMLLIDEMPYLTGDVNDIKWSALPIENIAQVEVIKGASSALYGSSALNGVINLRTASPGIKPSTTLDVTGGLYMKPIRKEMAWWWDYKPLKIPAFGNIRFSHLRKAGDFDITIGASALGDEGYRQDNYIHYGRIDGNIRYNPHKVKGLSVGFATNLQFQASSDFLIWEDADSGAFIQNPAAVSPTHGTRFNIDPYTTYFDKKDGRHSLKTRYYKVTNLFNEDPDKENGSDYFFGEYQYHREFRDKLNWTAGMAASYTIGRSNLYGDHHGSTQALYTQLDYRLHDKLSLSLGLRWERYEMDAESDSRPVVRTGLNYQVAEYTFIRASFGQGYRYPSMAEKYTATGLAGLKIFPNPDLKPETGWSTELGIKQGYRAGKWSGYIDLAGYWMEYNNMIEFAFGVFKPDSVENPTLDDVGFKSLNIGKARINGVDVSVTGQGKAGQVLLRFFAGYTYMNPLDLSSDTLENNILKYRYRHSAKCDITAGIKQFSFGLTFVYQSFMERIDEAFEEKILGQYFFPGLKEYRQEHNHGSVVFDLRADWQITPSSRIGFQVKNLFNEEYMGRPGDIQPPRSFSLQYLLKI